MNQYEFGISVAISDDFIIVGSNHYSSTFDDAGLAYIFSRNTTDDTWEQTQTLSPSDIAANKEFGISVAISGNYVIVGAFKDDHDDDDDDDSDHNYGAVYIFERNVRTNTWGEVSKIIGEEENNEEFGRTVALDGNYAIVGSWKDNNKRGRALHH